MRLPVCGRPQGSRPTHGLRATARVAPYTCFAGDRKGRPYAWFAGDRKGRALHRRCRRATARVAPYTCFAGDRKGRALRMVARVRRLAWRAAAAPAALPATARLWPRYAMPAAARCIAGDRRVALHVFCGRAGRGPLHGLAGDQGRPTWFGPRKGRALRGLRQSSKGQLTSCSVASSRSSA